MQTVFPPTQVMRSMQQERQQRQRQELRKSDVFKVPDSPPPKHAGQRLGEIEEEMNSAKETRTLTKVDLSILASLDQAKLLQKELDTLQRGKVTQNLFPRNPKTLRNSIFRILIFMQLYVINAVREFT